MSKRSSEDTAGAPSPKRQKSDDTDCEWDVVYWDMPSKGRVEFIRLVFHAADVAFKEVGGVVEGGIPSHIAAYPKEPMPLAEIMAKKPKWFAPPWIRNTKTGFEISQTANIMEYLAEQFDLIPTSSEDRAVARQVVLTAMDFINDGRAVFHPKHPIESYSIQKEEASVAIAKFVADGDRLDRHLAHTVLLLAGRGNDGSKYFFGDKLTYADCALYHVLDAVAHQFPEAWAAESRAAEVAVASRYMTTIEGHPVLGKYLAGPRKPWGGDSMM